MKQKKNLIPSYLNIFWGIFSGVRQGPASLLGGHLQAGGALSGQVGGLKQGLLLQLVQFGRGSHFHQRQVWLRRPSSAVTPEAAITEVGGHTGEPKNTVGKNDTKIVLDILCAEVDNV